MQMNEWMNTEERHEVTKINITRRVSLCHIEIPSDTQKQKVISVVC